MENKKNKLIIKYFKKIVAYKRICREAGVPEFIIDYPEFFFANQKETVRRKHIRWAKKKIKQLGK